MPPYVTADWVTALQTPANWREASFHKEIFVCETPEIFEMARHRMGNVAPRQADIKF